MSEQRFMLQNEDGTFVIVLYNYIFNVLKNLLMFLQII